MSHLTIFYVHKHLKFFLEKTVKKVLQKIIPQLHSGIRTQIFQHSVRAFYQFDSINIFFSFLNYIIHIIFFKKIY